MTDFRLPRLLSGAARAALGAALGLGLAVAVAFQPAQAFAQAATPVAREAAGGGPRLWVVRDADSTIYLFGAVHVLRPETTWRWAGVEAAFDSASDVWFEISNPDDQAAVLPLVQQHGLSPDRPLSSLLTPAEFADLGRAAGTMGLTAQQMDPFRPWLASLTLSVAPMIKAGYDPQSGVELVLKARAEAAGKRVHGFETIDKQVALLAGMSEADQLSFLRSTLEDMDDSTTELDRLVEAWSVGDVAAVERLGVREMRRDDETVYQTLLVRRNVDWAGQIEDILEGSGVAFIAVGAAHLVGPDSVQAQLARRGVRVQTAMR
jgi:uncharacterized protein YbaP (TraB family)